MRSVRRTFSCLALVFVANCAFAHEMTMAEMELRETRPGEFLWQWGASGSPRCICTGPPMTGEEWVRSRVPTWHSASNIS